MGHHQGAQTSQLYRKLLQSLHTAVIPRVKSGGIVNMTLAQLPFIAPAGTSVIPHSGRMLSEQPRRTYHAYQHWPAEHLESVRSPCLIYVIEGEADFRIGITRSMVSHLESSRQKQEYSRYDYLILSVPAGAFVLVPPGIPHSDGSIGHWERRHAEPAHSRILWLRTLPIGFFCHICSTHHGTHSADPFLFAQDTQINAMMKLLLEERQNRGIHYQEVAQSQLLAMLLRVSRALSSHKAVAVDGVSLDFAAAQGLHKAASTPNSSALQRACSYIEANLHEQLTVQDIADEAFASPTHLNRLFRMEFGQSPMKYVTRRRLETAQALLIESDLPINEVGKLVGYDNPSYFAQFFVKQTSEPASDYRKRHRIRSKTKRKSLQS